MIFQKIIKLFKILKNNNYFKNFVQYGVAASIEHSEILAALKPAGFQTILDIGANRGQFSLVARKYFPTAKILSFEPIMEAAAVYRRVFASDSNVTLFETAIGSEEEVSLLHISKSDDSSSLLPITPLQNKLFPGTSEKESLFVQVKPLSSILKKEDIAFPALLKMDVQGFEMNALRACQPFFDSFLNIYVECSFVELYSGQTLADGVIAYLRDAGFVLCGIYNLIYDRKGVSIQGDFLFSKKRDLPG